MNSKDLKKLKKNLPVGSRVKIANELGLSVSYVSYVLNGKRLNPQVIQHAIDLAKSSSEINESLKSQIQELK